MKNINLRDIPAEPSISPKGKFGCISQNISIALGRDPDSTDFKTGTPSMSGYARSHQEKPCVLIMPTALNGSFIT